MILQERFLHKAVVCSFYAPHSSYLSFVLLKEYPELATRNKRFLIGCNFTKKLLVCENVDEQNENSIICTNITLMLLFNILSTLYHSTLHRKWLTGWRNELLQTIRRYASLGDMAETLLSALIACQQAIILKATSLLFPSKCCTLLRVQSLVVTCFANRLLPIFVIVDSVWKLP